MGVSSDGIFFYGLIWKDTEEPWKSPSPDELQKSAGGEPDWEELYESRSGKKIEACPVRMGIHCSFEHSMHLLAIKETMVEASRGYPEQAKILTVKPEYEGQLREFCEIMGIKWRDPAWWVTSLYG
jgi:hypothetical protein